MKTFDKPIEEELERFLKQSMKFRNEDMVNASRFGMYDFLKGRYEECKVMCDHFGITTDELVR